MTNDPPKLSIDLLEELERQWRAQDAPLVAGLAPGLTDAEIDALTEPIGLRLPAEPRLWWRWHDGAARDAKLKVEREMGAPGYVAWSLAEAVDRYRSLRKMVKRIFTDDDEDPDWWWDPGWFPMTFTTFGATLACDCTHGGDITPILLVSHSNVDGFRRHRARSLGELVTWWIEALDNRGWEYNAQAREWWSDPAGLDTAREATWLI